MTWELRFSPQALKDAEALKGAGLKAAAERVLKVLREDPFRPRFEKLRGDLVGCYSRRISRTHRLVYELDEAARVVRVLRMGSHYGE